MTPHGAAIRAFLVADIRGFTRFTADFGDEDAARLAMKFADVVGKAVAARNGTLVELRGDEALSVFDSARQGLHAAVELQAAFREETQADPSLPLMVGIGLDAGEAVAVGGGIPRRGLEHGRPALCAGWRWRKDRRQPRLIHLTAAMPGLTFVDLGPRELKGLPQAVTPMRVEANEAPSDVEPLPATIRVVLADDAALLREALAASLKAAGFEVVGQAGDVAELLSLVATRTPDVAVVDVRMPPTHTTEGLEATREIVGNIPRSRSSSSHSTSRPAMRWISSATILRRRLRAEGPGHALGRPVGRRPAGRGRRIGH